MFIQSIFLESAIKRFREYKSLADRSFARLEEKDFHFVPDEVSNSLAIIIQHMHGNKLSRWTNFLTEDGEKEWRKRDDEFEKHDFNRSQLMEQWEEGWKVCLDALESLNPSDLDKTIYIRQQPLNVIDAINRQLAHYSYHVGQITYIARWIKGKEWQSLSIPKGPVHS